MKSNVPNMQNGVVKAGEFSYTRKSRTLKAYGEEFTIPVKTVEFGDKLDEIGAELAGAKNTSEVIRVTKKGIALFIGEEATEKLYPEEKFMELDVDEVIEFWSALNFELNRAQNERLARYAAAKAIRR
ncbi:MAG: hypothetical protein K2H90_03500 [Oscillospiraceae bacterium]|nr:hypothetical protein [Oscillospiraceae bacterium]